MRKTISLLVSLALLAVAMPAMAQEQPKEPNALEKMLDKTGKIFDDTVNGTAKLVGDTAPITTYCTLGHMPANADQLCAILTGGGLFGTRIGLLVNHVSEAANLARDPAVKAKAAELESTWYDLESIPLKKDSGQQISDSFVDRLKQCANGIDACTVHLNEWALIQQSVELVKPLYPHDADDLTALETAASIYIEGSE